MTPTAIIPCSCGQHLRVPASKGALAVTCPACDHCFDWAPLAPDPKRLLDVLFHETTTYKSSAAYAALLQFINRFPQIAPFNCSLIHMQYPAACYVANSRTWRERFGRSVKEGARPLVILMPFAPVDFLYDVSDTCGGPLPLEITDPFRATGDIPDLLWSRTLENCARDLVFVTVLNQHEANAGRITTRLDPSDYVECRVREGGQWVVERKRPLYRLVLNQKHERSAQYATLVHELAHLYCGHLGTPNAKWWADRRGATLDQREFEAESVSFIVCARRGIQTPSAGYLATYLNGHGKVPDISLETVIKVSGHIEEIGERLFPAKESPQVS
jgi:hypothetical protein